MRELVEVYYQLHSRGNRANYLKFLQTGWTFLNPNPNEVKDVTRFTIDLTNNI